MADSRKNAAKPEAKAAEAASTEEQETVKVKANPGCFRGGVGQVAVTVNQVKYFIHTNRPVEVSREIYEEMRKQDVRGRQAVILD